MIRYIYIILIIWGSSYFSIGQARIDSLSEIAQFSILTVSPGQSLETLFGHSAIRIYDPALRINKVYNYGTFDFEKPNFASNFLKGKLNYWLAIDSFGQFLRGSKYYNRAVWEQVLALDQTSKQEVYNFLETNHLPENRNYLYDFFFDNCSTRIRDVFESTLPGFSYQDVAEQNTITYRKLLDQYLINKEWTDFGMDLILGQPSDQIADFKGQMYIPDYLMQYAEHMYYKSSDDKNVKLVSNSEQILFQKPIESTSFLVTPLKLFILFLLFEVVLLIVKHKIPSRFKIIYDRLWFFVLFISAVIIFLMWFATDHKVCQNNWNVLWVTPLPFVIQFFNNPSNKRILSLGMIFYFTLFVAFWSLFPQDFSIVSILIASIFVLKYIRISLENI